VAKEKSKKTIHSPLDSAYACATTVRLGVRKSAAILRRPTRFGWGMEAYALANAKRDGRRAPQTIPNACLLAADLAERQNPRMIVFVSAARPPPPQAKERRIPTNGHRDRVPSPCASSYATKQTQTEMHTASV
jgi:hypothetical protein